MVSGKDFLNKKYLDEYNSLPTNTLKIYTHWNPGTDGPSTNVGFWVAVFIVRYDCGRIILGSKSALYYTGVSGGGTEAQTELNWKQIDLNTL